MSRLVYESAIDFDQLLSASDTVVATSELALIGSGFSSSAYQTNSHVVKLLKATYPTYRSAGEQAETLYREQQATRLHLPPRNIAVAHFVVGRSWEEDYRVMLVQERIDGVTISEALSAGAHPGPFAKYFSHGLSMYDRIQMIPDLACIQNRFDPLTDTNTQVVIDRGDVTPILVDTTFGRTQRRPYIGRLFHKAIALGVERALRKLD